MNPEAQAVLESYPEEIRTGLLRIRELIFDTAESLGDIGVLEETLKWGEVSYLTPESKSGSTIRMGWKETIKDQYSIYFKCTANLVPAFRERYAQLFNFGGNRSINFVTGNEIPAKELKRCIALALTYHRNKKFRDAERWEMIDKLI